VTARSDVAYLAELMRDFPAGKSITPQKAIVMIQGRYQSIEQLTEKLVEFFSRGKVKLPETFMVTGFFHFMLFHDILSNAGKFRLPTEPNHGYVGFGKVDVRSPSIAQFNGTPADRIEDELSNAFTLFSLDDRDSVRSSVVFYQKFVRIHPFYDANGRIARALVSIYLRMHHYLVLWKGLETTKKNEFIKKLNACHKREKNPELLAEYHQHLVSFWKKFVVPISEVTGPE
jgi:fido (protein-threonine AMPylation protein)